MQLYIKQLLGDIEDVIKNPPPAPYIEIPSHMADTPDMAELELNPQTTLEELTRIHVEAFPNILRLKNKEWKVLTEALKRLLEALNIKIIDLPDNYPDDALYDLIVMHWDDPVQYLPNAGYDIEFCTSDPDTCPYGEDCIYCYDNEEFDELGPGFIGGIFNDDGTTIDPLKVPIPELYLRCKRHLSDDWKDDILCTLNRNDQIESKDFECGSFE